MKSALIRLTLTFCILMVMIANYSQPVSANPPQQELPDLAATLEVLTDGVEILPSGTEQWIAVSGRTAITAGDTIRTNNTGTAMLVWFTDGTFVEIQPNTHLHVNEFKGSTPDAPYSIEATLIIGRIFNSVNRLVDPTSRYSINTPTFQTAVRGTIFGVDVSPRLETTLVVTQGSIGGTQGIPPSVFVDVLEGFWIRTTLKDPVGNPLTFAEAGNDAVVLALIAGGQRLQTGVGPLGTAEPADGGPAFTQEPVFTAEPDPDPEPDDDDDNSGSGSNDDDD